MAPENSPAAEEGAPKSLTRRFLSASMWSVLKIFVSLSLRLGSNLILTRLLLPEAFGLMAFAMMVLVGATMLADIGISFSIMREKEGEKPHFLRAAWTVNVLRGAMISACVALFALVALPFAGLYAPEGSVLADPRTTWVTAIIAIAPLLQNLTSMNEYLAQRKLEVRQVVIFEVTAQLIGLAILLTTVYLNPTVWSLVTVFVVNVALRSGLSHLMLRGPRMAFVWDPEISQRLWAFGKWIIGSSFFDFSTRFSERMIFSAVIDISLYGLYAVARLWAETAQQLFSFVMAQSGSAALSEVIRRNDGKLAGPFGKLQTVVDLLAVGGFLGFYFLSGPFMRLIYPDSFDPAGDIAPVLSLLVLRLRFSTFDSVLLTSGQSRPLMFCRVQDALASWLLVWLVFQNFGFTSAIVAYCCAGLVSVPYVLIKVRPMLQGRNFTMDWLWLGFSLALGLYVLWIQP